MHRTEGMTMMTTPHHAITAPSRRSDPLQRETECRAALKDSFDAVALAAEQVGWTADETALALLRLAGAHVNERVISSIALTTVRRNQLAHQPERRTRRISD